MKSEDVKQAEKQVDMSIAQFENAVNQLIDKVGDTQAMVQAKIDQAVETVQAPIEFVREVRERGEDIVDYGAEKFRLLMARVRANPEPYISYAALAFGLFLCFRAVRNDRRIRLNKPSWSQLEP